MAVHESSTFPVAVQEGKYSLTCVLCLQNSCLFLLIISRHAGSGGSQVGQWGSSEAIEEHDAGMIIKYKGPRTVDKMEQTDIAGRRSFSSGNGRRNYIELRTAVGEAGVERGLASGGAPCWLFSCCRCSQVWLFCTHWKAVFCKNIEFCCKMHLVIDRKSSETWSQHRSNIKQKSHQNQWKID